ncbi:MAG: dockerin type I repeat-containing protein [Porcipelethomonas sp.]
MKNIRRALSMLISVSCLACLVSSPVAADSECCISMGDDCDCAAGQLIELKIDVSAGNDFESAQLRLDYGDSEINMQKALTTIPNLSVSSKAFADEGYMNIVVYTNDGSPIEDGTIVSILFNIPQDAASEYIFTLEPEVFARCTKGDTAVEKCSICYTVNRQLGDANGDNELNVRDAAYISRLLSTGSNGSDLPAWADFNGDGDVNVRDSAAIAREIATAKQ